MGRREPQTTLKTDERCTVLEFAARGEIRRQIKGWDENPVFLYGNKLEVAVKNGRWY